MLLCVIFVVIQYFANDAQGADDRLQLHELFIPLSLLQANQHSNRKSCVPLRHLSMMLQVAPAEMPALVVVRWLSRQSRWPDNLCVRGLRRLYCSAMRVQSEGMRQA